MYSFAEKHKKLLLQKKIASPLAIALLDYLFIKPHLSVQEAAEQLQISFQTAQDLLVNLNKWRF